MRRVDGTAPLPPGPAPQERSVAGLAACLALLELEARALGHPLAAMLLAAAGEALRERPAGSGISGSGMNGSGMNGSGISGAGCPPPG